MLIVNLIIKQNVLCRRLFRPFLHHCIGLCIFSASLSQTRLSILYSFDLTFIDIICSVIKFCFRGNFHRLTTEGLCHVFIQSESNSCLLVVLGKEGESGKVSFLSALKMTFSLYTTTLTPRCSRFFGHCQWMFEHSEILLVVLKVTISISLTGLTIISGIWKKFFGIIWNQVIIHCINIQRVWLNPDGGLLTAVLEASFPSRIRFRRDGTQMITAMGSRTGKVETAMAAER